MVNKNVGPKWNRYHYNALAKEIREIFPTAWADSDPEPKTAASKFAAQTMADRRSTLAALAISLAKRFKEDNPNFYPVSWLNQCSPNRNLYPLGELWEEHER